jgi:hypothetical protein
MELLNKYQKKLSKLEAAMNQLPLGQRDEYWSMLWGERKILEEVVRDLKINHSRRSLTTLSKDEIWMA